MPNVFKEEKMNKRLLCLLLSFVMLMSVVLTGCSGDDDAGDVIMKEGAKNTMTISMYLMSEEAVSAEQEKKLEDAVNLITKSKFKLQVDLRYFTPDKYYEELENAMAATQAEIEANKNNNKGGAKKTSAGATSVTEEATIINSLGIPELAYPSISENRVDIFYVGGYDKLNHLIDKTWVATLDDALSSESKLIADYVSETYLKYLNKVSMGATYMIPSNIAVGEYTYMLLNKDILAKYNYSSTKGFNSLTSDNVKDILANVHAYDKDYLPLYSSTGELDLLDITYYGVNSEGKLTYDFSVMGGRCDPSWKYLTANNFYDFHNIFTSTEFKSQMRVLTEYRLNGYYGTEADADKPFAIGYVKGSADIEEKYGEDYELIVLSKPKMSTDQLYAHGFAVSSFNKSDQITRCMDVVTYLNTNEDFRNLILYGIEDDNYEIVEKEVNGVTYKTVNRLNNSYMMDVNKTGNVILAYPTVDELPNIREYQKIQNRDTSVMLDLGFVLDMDDPDDKEGEKEENDDHDYINVVAMGKVAELSAQLKSEMLAVESLEELDAFFTYAENKVANDKYFAAMVNILYCKTYKNEQKPELSYNAEEFGTGAGFAYLYKAWLDMNRLWVE